MSNVSNGLKLELRPKSASYSSGELPSFEAVLTNVSSAPVVFCAYKAQHRLLSTLHADGFEMVPFRPTPKDAITSNDYVTLAPGGSAHFHLDLPAAARDGYRVIWAGSLPPVIDESIAIAGFPAGSFNFKAHLGDFISFFTAPAGKAGPRERIHIVKAVPGAAAPASQVWTGDVIAETRVTFSG